MYESVIIRISKRGDILKRDEPNRKKRKTKKINDSSALATIGLRQKCILRDIFYGIVVEQRYTDVRYVHQTYNFSFFKLFKRRFPLYRHVIIGLFISGIFYYTPRSINKTINYIYYNHHQSTSKNNIKSTSRRTTHSVQSEVACVFILSYQF